jgi:hypothetical protein
LESEITDLLQHAGERFSSWLTRYQAWHGVNGITERNLSVQVALSFLARFPDGAAFMEVPFATSERASTDKHLDAYLFCDSLALLVESKIVWSPQHVSWMAEDIDRMSLTLLTTLRARHFGPLPAATHGLVLAETWNERIAAWWVGDDSARPRWSREPLTRPRFNGAWQYGCLPVREVRKGHEGTLFWLYGVSPAFPTSAPVTTA